MKQDKRHRPNLAKQWELSFDGKGIRDAGTFLSNLVDAIMMHRAPDADPGTIGYQTAVLHFACFNFVNKCATELGILQAQYDLHTSDNRLSSKDHIFTDDLGSYLYSRAGHIPQRLSCVNAKRLRRVQREFHRYVNLPFSQKAGQLSVGA